MKKIALINDLSGFGKCSLTAAIPVISVMGIQACPLPTAILTAQTGFESYYCDDYTDRMDLFTEEWKKMQVSFDGIYSGFLASPEQIKKVLHFLEEFKTQNNIYLLDPIMGDNGNTAKIFCKELLEGMKQLALYADVIVPNLTELCLLTETDYEELITYKNSGDYLEKIQAICEKQIQKSKYPQSIVVTGIKRERDGCEYMGNLVFSASDKAYVEKPYIQKSFSGTGDLFASVVCGSLIKGISLVDSVKNASDFLWDAIREAAQKQTDSRHGIFFEKYLYKLID